MLLTSLVVGAEAASAAAPIEVYLYDYAQVPASEMRLAKKFVASLYAQSGVEIVWSAPADWQAPMPGAPLPLQMVVVPADMSAQKTAESHHSGDVFGSASYVARRAFVFYERVDRYAERHASNRAVVLALVIAHELGHLLLPPPSHSRTGLMRPNFSGSINSIPQFEKPQQRALQQTALSDSRPPASID